MSSFLNRLKKKDVIPATPEDTKRDQIEVQNTSKDAEATPVADQLRVDIFQTKNAILVYAQIAGASVHDFGVTIDGDVVTIKGQRIRPNGEYFDHPGTEGKEHVLEECSWGKFYRQIILPAEVEADKAQAKMRDGVLMLLLPLKETSDTGVRITVTEVS